ncbi:hypothetical protein CEXT_170011, partial [Caerostris extrusa]
TVPVGGYVTCISDINSSHRTGHHTLSTSNIFRWQPLPVTRVKSKQETTSVCDTVAFTKKIPNQSQEEDEKKKKKGGWKERDRNSIKILTGNLTVLTVRRGLRVDGWKERTFLEVSIDVRGLRGEGEVL